jgi:hypothetical protein
MDGLFTAAASDRRRNHYTHLLEIDSVHSGR